MCLTVLGGRVPGGGARSGGCAPPRETHVSQSVGSRHAARPRPLSSCHAALMGEQEVREKKKDKPSTLQLIRQSPFYRNVSGRLSLNDRSTRNRADSPNSSILNGGSLLPKKLSFRKSNSAAATPSSPDADDGGFATWRGSCEGLSQLQDIIRRRTDALAEEDEIRNVPKSQSAYVISHAQRQVPAQPVTAAPTAYQRRTDSVDLSFSDVSRRPPSRNGSCYDLSSSNLSRRGSRTSINTIDQYEPSHYDQPRRPASRPTTLETSRTSSPARPTSLPTSVSLENTFSKRPSSTPNCDIWIPPENIVLRKPVPERPSRSKDNGIYQEPSRYLSDVPHSRPLNNHYSTGISRSTSQPGSTSSAVEYNNIISKFPFYTPPAPLPSNTGTRAVRPYGLVSSATVPSGLGSSFPASYQPQIVSTPVVYSSNQMSWNPPSSSGYNQPSKRPHSIAATPEYESYLKPSIAYPVSNVNNIGWTSSSSGSLRRHTNAPTSVPATTSAALSPSDSGYRSLPSSSSDYQLYKNPPVTSQPPPLTTSSLPLPSRRLSLPTSTQQSLNWAPGPRPSPTFHGQPFRPTSANGLPYSSNAARQALQMLLANPRNGFILGDDKIALLMDILDTQERFAQVKVFVYSVDLMKIA